SRETDRSQRPCSPLLRLVLSLPCCMSRSSAPPSEESPRSRSEPCWLDRSWLCCDCDASRARSPCCDEPPDCDCWLPPRPWLEPPGLRSSPPRCPCCPAWLCWPWREPPDWPMDCESSLPCWSVMIGS